MTLNDLTVNFRHLNATSLIEDWRWLVGESLQPILVTSGGNAFLQHTQDSSIHFLETAFGSLKQVASSPQEFDALLAQPDFVYEHFSVHMITDLMHAGLKLPAGSVYSFKHPLVLGGGGVLENVEACGIEVHFSLLGQIHNQISTLPEGTRISNVNIK